MATHSSVLGNAMGRGAWRATVHEVAKESDLTATKQQHVLVTGPKILKIK